MHPWCVPSVLAGGVVVHSGDQRATVLSTRYTNEQQFSFPSFVSVTRVNRAKLIEYMYLIFVDLA